MSIRLIAAMAENRCIGKDGQLPWHLPEDMKRFKELTMGQTVLMGRKTWESLPEKFRPLPGRKNVILTRDASYVVPENVDRFDSLEDALKQHPDLFIIGGAEIYRQALPFANELHLTRVQQTVDGDTFFPMFEDDGWDLIEEIPKEGFSFLTYKKI